MNIYRYTSLNKSFKMIKLSILVNDYMGLLRSLDEFLKEKKL